jgi:UDP-N-acetylglucosamine 2-epimerase (non-hydrolysing)
LTSHIASLHFAPTSVSRDNLIKEGINPQNIVVTGNPVIDALLLTLNRVRRSQHAIKGLDEELMGRKNSPRIVLITGHRRENIGAGFESICRAIGELSKRFMDVHFVYPVHLNPKVRKTVLNMLGYHGGYLLPNVHLIEPIPYSSFVALMNQSTLILTDSGGIQEEAPSLGKPVLVMRDTSERPEAISAGTARLVGTSEKRIAEEVTRLLNNSAAYKEMSHKYNPYGDGKAAMRIVRAIIERYI